MRILRLILVGQIVLGATLFAGSSRSRQQAAAMPRIENAQVETAAVSGTLEATLRGIAAKADGPLWAGYAVDQIAGERSVCCGNFRDDSSCGTCKLEKDHEGTST